ncbi:MAG: hypothetical protein GX066_05790 [Clostridiaceae bacterium]|nr:hypothetical protein [Clostridiaceae bacterium]
MKTNKKYVARNFMEGRVRKIHKRGSSKSRDCPVAIAVQKDAAMALSCA